MTKTNAFFRVHDGLPREGPGEARDITRVAQVAGLGPAPRVADLGSGPGGDIPALLEAYPEATVLAADTHAPFIEALRARIDADPRVTAKVADMAEIDGPFDLIWCAGALYFLGLVDGLATLKSKLAPGGVLAFSHPCHKVDAPSAAAQEFWEGYSVGDRDDLVMTVGQAELTVLDDWHISDAAWREYYDPMEERIAILRPVADAALAKACDINEAEYTAWRQVREETGYRLVAARRDDD